MLFYIFLAIIITIDFMIYSINIIDIYFESILNNI